jgi:hypothetical protein
MISSLKLDPFTRALWNEYDAYAIAQIEALTNDPCYRPKFYTAPDLLANNLGGYTPGVPAANQAGAYVEYGLQITPGSLIVGSSLFSTAPTSFLVQLTDVSLDHTIFDQPVPAIFLANAKGDMPNIWTTPHPVCGSGLFRCEFWNQLDTPQLIFLVLCVLEPCDPQ